MPHLVIGGCLQRCRTWHPAWSLCLQWRGRKTYQQKRQSGTWVSCRIVLWHNDTWHSHFPSSLCETMSPVSLMTPGTATFPRHCVRQCHPCLWWHLAQPPSHVTVWDNVTRVSDDTWHSHLPSSLCETMSPVSLMTPGTATSSCHCETMSPVSLMTPGTATSSCHCETISPVSLMTPDTATSTCMWPTVTVFCVGRHSVSEQVSWYHAWSVPGYEATRLRKYMIIHWVC